MTIRWLVYEKGMPRRARFTVLAVGSFAAFSWAILGCGGSPDAADFPTERARCTVEVAVPNMACETACPIKVRALLADVEGVQDVNVDFEHRHATVEGVWPACGHKGFRQMLANLATRGYQGQIISSQ